MKSPLRDLADLIQRTAMEHPAYGQGALAVVNCVDHLCAMARVEETNRNAVINLGWRFKVNDRVRKIKGSSWRGKVVGLYSTGLTPRGYAVESECEPGSVQIYPEDALIKQ